MIDDFWISIQDYFQISLRERSGDPKAPNPNYSNILAVLV